MRFFLNKTVLLLCSISAIIGMLFLGWIISTLFIKGIASLNWYIFANDLVDNGIRNLILGQFILTGLATLLGAPIGILAGIYLQEYINGTKYARFIRDLNDAMMCLPSIIVGAFVYGIFIVPLGHSSGWGGVFALFILIVPIVIRATDDMLSLIPKELREAGIAIGAAKYQVTLHIILKSAKVGIVTGLTLAFARVVGETAPLLFTSASNQFFSLDLNQQFPSLTVSVYQLATMPSKSLVQLAWSASLVLTLFILFLNIMTKIMLRKKNTT